MIENYGAAERRARGGVVLLVVGAVVLGLAGGAAWLRWNAPQANSGPSGPIEWNAVQAVPTRAPDAEDVAWEKRAGGKVGPSTSSGRAGTTAPPGSRNPSWR